MTESQALRLIEKHGLMLESARFHAVPNLADEVLGKDRRGSWWGHARGKEFFRLTRQIRARTDILVCRLVAGKITYVHRRLWPAAVRLAPVFGSSGLAAIRERHTRTGAHQVERTPLSRWVPASVRKKASRLTLADGRDAIGDRVVDAIRDRRARSQKGED